MVAITPFLWFDDNAEQAIQRYCEVFADAEILSEQRNRDGTLFIGEVRLQGQHLVLMNGGPAHKLSDAFSLSVQVDTQAEVDRISDTLIAGGGYQQPCGWLTDAFGLSWQVVPTTLFTLMGDPDPVKAARVRDAMLQMTRLNVAGLQAAYDAD